MPGYKNYASEGRAVPKSTIYYRRKQKKKFLLLRENYTSHIQNELPAHVLQIEDTTAPLQAGSCNTLESEPQANTMDRAHDLSSSDSDILPVGCDKERKRKKLKKKSKNTQKVNDAALLLPSSDSEQPISDTQSIHSPLPSPVPSTSEMQENSGNQESETIFLEADDEADCSQTNLKFHQDGKVKLCPCTDIAVGDILFMILTLGLRHGLTWAAQCDVLKMFATVFKNKEIPLTKHLFLESLNVNYKGDIDRHIFCQECQSYLGKMRKHKQSSNKKDIEKVKFCTVCNKNVEVSKPDNFFVSLSIESQLKNLLSQEEFVDYVMNYRFQRRSETAEMMRDIYDGNVYKKFSENGGVLSSPFNFSYTFFTDGVAYGKSSNKTIWPIYLTINELPYRERSEYLILAGVYAGSKDPDQRYFLKPFVAEANKLSSEGVTWNYKGETVCSKVIPLCCVADSVARYQMLNLQSFHASFGCTFCYKQSVFQRGGMRYTFSAPAPLRTKESLMQDLQEVYERRHEVQEKNRICRGVKGPCTLMDLKYFDVTSGFVVDYMHAVLLGVVKTHTELMFESTRKKMWKNMQENVGMNHLKDTIDLRIKAIQSNSAVIRELRPLKDFKLWRASELKIWIVFYCLPCLSDLLENKYLLHLGMLSKAISILMKESLHFNEIANAHRLLISYSYFFEKYFGEENMVYNVHLLSHIAKGVFDYGPVWGHNSFVYEAQNRYLLQLCKSPFSVALQIGRKFLTYSSLSYLCPKLVTCEESVKYATKMICYKRLVKCERSSGNVCVLLGRGSKNSDPDNAILSQYIFPCTSNNCLFYNRILYKRVRYTTASYSDKMQNNDSFAILRDGKCVCIKKIVMLPSRNVVLLVQNVNIQERSCFVDCFVSITHLKKVETFGELSCITVESIAGPCLLLNIQGMHYVASIPFGCSVE